MLGEKIKTLRDQKELTQSALGALVGVGQTTILMYEKGKLTPSPIRLIRLAQALDVQSSELLDCLATEAELTLA